MSRNFLGGFYQPGKPLPVFVREEIVDLYNNGVGVSEISRNTKVTKGAVHKVVQHFALHGKTQPFSCGGSELILITDDIHFEATKAKSLCFRNPREIAARRYLYASECSTH